MKPTKGCVHRLTQELRRYSKYAHAIKHMQDPIPNIEAQPDPGNILEWHFVITGAPGTPYAGGTYHGKLLFPPDYPFKPPGILFVTPSGRFHPGQKICFSFSDFHPENGQVQAWNPIWHVSTILNATQSFMNDESRTSGSMHAPPAERHKLARQSLANSCKHPMFRKLFPHLVEKHQKQVQEEEEQKQQEAEDAARQKAGSAEAGAGGKRPGGDARVGSIGHTIWRLIPSAFVAVMALGILLVQYLPSRR